MQVILKEDMDNLGKSGEVVNVKEGYGRNYLLPRGLAVIATADDVARVAHEKRVIAARARQAGQGAAVRGRSTGPGHRLDRARRSATRTSCSARSRAATSPRRWRSRRSPIDAKKIHLDEPLKALGHDRGRDQARPGRDRQDQGLGGQEGIARRARSRKNGKKPTNTGARRRRRGPRVIFGARPGVACPAHAHSGGTARRRLWSRRRSLQWKAGMAAFRESKVRLAPGRLLAAALIAGMLVLVGAPRSRNRASRTRRANTTKRASPRTTSVNTPRRPRNSRPRTDCFSIRRCCSTSRRRTG